MVVPGAAMCAPPDILPLELGLFNHCGAMVFPDVIHNFSIIQGLRRSPSDIGRQIGSDGDREFPTCSRPNDWLRRV